MHKPEPMGEREPGHTISPLCHLHATAVGPGHRYGARHVAVQQRVLAMLAYIVNEGRLFALRPSDWSMLLVGVALCGLAALLF